MKVALINDTFLIKGGTERHIVDAAALLKFDGIETVFVNCQDEQASVETYAFPELFSLNLFQTDQQIKVFHQFKDFLEQHKVDIVHLVHVYNPYLTTFLSARLPTVRTIHTAFLFCLGGTRYLPKSQQVCLKRCGISCCLTHLEEGCIRYDRKKPFSLKHQLKKLWIVKANQDADKTLHRIGVASNFMKNLLVQHDYPEDKIDVMPPPLPATLTVSGDNTFPDNKLPAIVFSGRLIPEKGASDVIKALSLMHVQARIIIVGDGSEKSRLEQQAIEYGVNERVEFRGWLSHDESKHVYQEGWVTVFPSHWPEPFGFSGIESFLNNRPVVAYDVGGVTEWLTDEKNGFLVEPCNVRQLAEKLDRMLQSPERCKEMGVWGNQSVHERFSQAKHLELKTRFYKEAIEAFNDQSCR